MASKYIDTTAIMQVIGNVFNNPQLLDFTDKYTITDDDFPNEFHRTVFGAIYKIHGLGAKHIGLENIADFLVAHPKTKLTIKQGSTHYFHTEEEKEFIKSWILNSLYQ